MDTLPPEILTQILQQVPSSSLPQTRQTCRIFNAVLAPRLFPSIKSFLDLKEAQTRLLQMASKPLPSVRRGRQRCVWSPYSAPPANLPVQDGFLGALFCSLTGFAWDVRWGEIDVPRVAEAAGLAVAWEGLRKERETGRGRWEGVDSDVVEDVLWLENGESRNGDVPQQQQQEAQLLEAEITEERLRVVQHKYSLYLSYVQGSLQSYHRYDLYVDNLPHHESCLCLTK
jgi:hypothetical protein